MYAKTMLFSFFYNNPGTHNVFIFHSRLTCRETADIISFIKKKNSRVNVLEIESDYFDDAPLYRGCTKEIYYRLLAIIKIPEDIKRILYLDIDIIVNNSLSDFYSTEFGQCYFIACEDSNHSQKNDELYEILNIPRGEKYFNSGVLLFNLDLLRKDNQFEAILSFMHGSWKKNNKWFHDQNVLNAMYYDKVVYKDYFLYNCLIKNVSGDKKEFCLNKSSIFHFAGIKPWDYQYPSGCYKIWWGYAIKAGYFLNYMAFIFRKRFYILKNKSFL